MKKLDYRNIFFLLICLIVFLRPFIVDEVYETAALVYNFLLFAIFLIFILIYPKSVFKNNILNFPILSLVLIYIFSILKYRNYNSGLICLLNLSAGISLFYLTSCLDVKEINSLLNVIIWAGIIVSLYGIYQYFWGFDSCLDYLSKLNPYILEHNKHYVEKTLISKRVFSTFITPNALAGYLIMVIPLLVVKVIKSIKYKDAFSIPAVFGSAFIILTTVLFFTKSLLSILSFIMVLCFLLFLTVNNMVSNRLLKKKLIFFSVITITVLFLLFVHVVFLRKYYAIDLYRLNWSIMQRFNYLFSTIEMIKEHPIFGFGVGNYAKTYLRFMKPGANFTVFVHNSYLQIWAEAGALGVLAFLSIVILFFKKSFIRIKKRDVNSNLDISVFCAGLAFLIHCVVDNDFFIAQVSYHWWVLVGIVIGLDKSS